MNMAEKLTGTATIKECTMTEKGAKLKFENLSVSLDQFKKIAAFVKEQEEVCISIRPIQDGLPMGDDESDSENK
jgi:hypothetical protein